MQEGSLQCHAVPASRTFGQRSQIDSNAPDLRSTSRLKFKARLESDCIFSIKPTVLLHRFIPKDVEQRSNSRKKKYRAIIHRTY